MDTVRLADILNYRLREHLGAGVDYRANALPNELALSVETLQPEYLRGFTFVGERGWETVPMRVMFNPNPNFQAFTINATPVPLAYDIETRTTREATLPTVMRTREQETRFLTLQQEITTRIFSLDESVEWNRLNDMTPFVEPARVRTAEQEERWIELGNTTDPWTPEQRHQYETLCQLLPHPHPIPPRTYIRVHRDRYNTWQISVRVGTEQRDLPSIAVIKSLINPADKHYLHGRQGARRSTVRILRNSLEAGLPAQSLHDALRAWVMATENQVTSAESSLPATGIDPATAQLLRAQPATLEVGGRVFRLVPAHEIDVRPLITRVRQRTIAHARVETDAMRERARTDARVLTTEAERQASRLRSEAEAQVRRAGAKAPDWVRDSGRPHYYSTHDDRVGYWYVQMKVSCYLRDIRYLVRNWGAVVHWKPLIVANHGLEWYNDERRKCPLWFRLSADHNGGYDKHSIFQADWDTPHVGSFMCMDLDNKPAQVKSVEDITNLEKAISRGMQVLNLNSPISRAVDSYHPAIREQIPPIPDKFLRGRVAIEPRAGTTIAAFKEANPTITWDSVETLVEESRGTFDVNAPVPTLPVPPIVEPQVAQVAELAEMIQQAQAVTGVVENEIVRRVRNAR